MSMYHEIGINMSKLIINWSTFSICNNLSQCCNVKKDYEGLDLMIVYLWNVAHVKRKPWEKQNSQKFSICFQIMKFILDSLKTFFSTLCYNNDEIFDLFKL
jgi:hypothetical protein